MGALDGMPFPGPSFVKELFISLETDDLDMRQVWVELELEWESSLEDDIWKLKCTVSNCLFNTKFFSLCTSPKSLLVPVKVGT